MFLKGKKKQKNLHEGGINVCELRSSRPRVQPLGSDGLCSCHKKGMQCGQGSLRYTQGMSQVVDDASGLHHDAFSVLTLKFFFLELP